MVYAYTYSRTRTKAYFIGEELAARHPLLKFIREEMLERLDDVREKANNQGTDLVETNDWDYLGIIGYQWKEMYHQDIFGLTELGDMQARPSEWQTEQSRAEWETKLQDRKTNAEGGPKHPEF